MDWSQTYQYLTTVVDRLVELLNSAFFSAFFSALSGAAFGAWGAKSFAEKQQKKDDLIETLRQTNALILLAGVVTNEALVLKRAHVGPVCAEYFKQREVFELEKKQLKEESAFSEMRLPQVNFLVIPPLLMPIDALKNIMNSSRFISGKAIVIVEYIAQYYALLSYSLKSRTEQIKNFSSKKLDFLELLNVYFGFKQMSGRTDSTFHNTTDAIRLYTDDVIFFAAELVEHLQAHADEVLDKLKAVSCDTHKRASADFPEARGMGLFPDRANYENWLKGFSEKSKNES